MWKTLSFFPFFRPSFFFLFFVAEGILCFNFSSFSIRVGWLKSLLETNWTFFFLTYSREGGGKMRGCVRVLGGLINNNESLRHKFWLYSLMTQTFENALIACVRVVWCVCGRMVYLGRILIDEKSNNYLVSSKSHLF